MQQHPGGVSAETLAKIYLPFSGRVIGRTREHPGDSGWRTLKGKAPPIFQTEQ